MMADSPENAEAAAAYAKERAEKLGADVAVASGTNAAAIGDTSAFIDDVAPLDAETDGAPDDKTLWAVPLLPYQTILTAEGIFTDEASAAHAMAALRVSASLQELGLSLPEAQTFMPPETTVDVATRILVSAAVLGYDQPTLNDLLQSAFRQSQEQAYSAWLDLTSAEEARALGVSDDHPVWQVQYGEDGVYRMRDVATYTFVKSFKLPLALLVFVAGWLVIILRALNRSLRYFDELSGAVGRLLADKDAPIELPADLSIARNELAVIRSQSLADERAAHAAEQRKNELVAYLAHDIRTPLTSTLGYLDLLRETTDLPRETLRKYADIAYSKAERLESLINEFFEITRYNLSAIPIERETVGVRLFCQQVAEAFFPEAAARDIRITVDAAGAGQFFIDPDKLARALGNVLRNAVAYADANSVIAIAARQDARTTTITVANRGREISDAHLETIFEKFYREDGARSSKKGGAELGLAIAREIVVAHHGDIEAASERGVTVFTLRIPTQGEEIEGAAAAPRIPGAPEGLQRPVAPVPPRTARPAGVRAIPRRLPRRRAAGPPPVRSAAPRRRTDARAAPRYLSVRMPRNARHGQVPARKTVRRIMMRHPGGAACPASFKTKASVSPKRRFPTQRTPKEAPLNPIRIGILGYGNLGRGIELAVAANDDMELVGVFTRRDPATVHPLGENVAVWPATELAAHTDDIDVLMLAGGSATDLPEQTPAARCALQRGRLLRHPRQHPGALRRRRCGGPRDGGTIGRHLGAAGIRACSRSRAFMPTAILPERRRLHLLGPRRLPGALRRHPPHSRRGWTPASTRCPCPRRWRPCAPAPTRS